MKTQIKSTNPVETYDDAIGFLAQAVGILDQAHTALKDVGMDSAIASRFWGQYVSLHDVMHMADTLLEDARNARCEYCCALLAGNDACLRNECPSLKELRRAEAKNVDSLLR